MIAGAGGAMRATGWRATAIRFQQFGEGGVFRAKMPGIRTLLCESSLGLKLQGRIRNALVCPFLSFD